MSESTNGGRERAYQLLRESEELHRATLENISDAVFLTDDDGLFTFICPNVDVIFGYVPDEVQALTRISRLLGDELFDRSQLAAEGEIRNIEREITSKSGERRTLLIHVKTVSINGGRVLYCCRDVTERRHAEEQLQEARSDLAHSSRLALIGELTATIAHEVNQPLMSIVTNAGAGLKLLAAGSPRALEELLDILRDICDQGHLAAEVIARIRALARKRPLERQALDVNKLATDTMRLIGGDARRRRVALCTVLGSSLPKIEADRVSLQQVLLNLALNAMDAMDQVAATERQLILRTVRHDDAVEVAVSDTGLGIPADRLPKLFSPFFTTKKEGIGLGLAISQSIVEAHGGRIWAEDNGGRGATFHVHLPSQRSAAHV